MISTGAGTQVVLLDPDTSAPCGTMEKLQAHRQARYHAAISVLILDNDGQQLIQRRAETKYHGAGMWANACCSHPEPGETPAMAAQRRVQEELGVAIEPAPFGTIRYRANVPTQTDGDLVENEHVSLFIARFSGACSPNPQEVSQTRWVMGPDFAGPSFEAPWYALYMKTFGSDLAAILARVEAGTIQQRNYGSFDLLKP